VAGIKNFLKISVMAMVLPTVAFGAQAPNPRGNTSSARNVANTQATDSNSSIRRSATSVIARSTAMNNRKNRTVVNARAAASSRIVSTGRNVRSVNNVVSSSANLSRAAATSVVKKAGATMGRNGALNSNIGKAGKNVSRANKARATAVFGDVSKIGGGYATCRDSYATCMDQFCGVANDTYRRCFCSDKFTDFKERADVLDSALQMLADFQDNNLNAVDKTAAEVNAMYTASAGEAAIKRDTSASQKLLDSIGDVLAGKKTSTATKKKSSSSSSLGVLDLGNFSSSLDNVFGGGSDPFAASSSSNSNYVDMSELEGKELFDNANQQCAEITREACKSDAMFNLARSSYSIFITQDCNLYEKSINAKKASVEETVRQAEKYLREARLEEYRAHNSADVNACLGKVEEAMKLPTSCGTKYEKCLDYTGMYINSTTGEPIYSKALFGLNSLIKLGNTSDVLGVNDSFNKFLDEKKIYAATALDTCREIADTVWYEYKRAALINIAQAQDEKIESVKDSCVATIKECYDTQTGAMNDLDTTQTKSTGAIAAVAARGMCYDKVMACAALYGDPDGCVYDDATKKLSPSSVEGKVCGLQSLLTLVDTIDSVRVAEGCQSALEKYVKELCPDKEETDDAGEKTKYEYGTCMTKTKGELRAAIEARAKIFCASDLVKAENEDNKNNEGNTIRNGAVSAFNLEAVNRVLKDIFDKLGIGFSTGCENVGGVWIDSVAAGGTPSDLHPEFYRKFYGVSVANADQVSKLNAEDMGYCIKGGLKSICQELGDLAEYDSGRNICTLKTAWYENQCKLMNGNYYNERCEIDNITNPE